MHGLRKQYLIKLLEVANVKDVGSLVFYVSYSTYAVYNPENKRFYFHGIGNSSYAIKQKGKYNRFCLTEDEPYYTFYPTKATYNFKLNKVEGKFTVQERSFIEVLPLPESYKIAWVYKNYVLRSSGYFFYKNGVYVNLVDQQRFFEKDKSLVFREVAYKSDEAQKLRAKYVKRIFEKIQISQDSYLKPDYNASVLEDAIQSRLTFHTKEDGEFSFVDCMDRCKTNTPTSFYILEPQITLAGYDSKFFFKYVETINKMFNKEFELNYNPITVEDGKIKRSLNDLWLLYKDKMKKDSYVWKVTIDAKNKGLNYLLMILIRNLWYLKNSNMPATFMRVLEVDKCSAYEALCITTKLCRHQCGWQYFNNCYTINHKLTNKNVFLKRVKNYERPFYNNIYQNTDSPKLRKETQKEKQQYLNLWEKYKK